MCHLPCAMFKEGGSTVANAAWKVAGAALVSSLCCLEKVQLDIISDGQRHWASAAMIIAVLIVEVTTIDRGNWLQPQQYRCLLQDHYQQV